MNYSNETYILRTSSPKNLALKETGSVSMAAKRVYLTQSALSHQIKLMEEQFGLPLLSVKVIRCVLPQLAIV